MTSSRQARLGVRNSPHDPSLKQTGCGTKVVHTLAIADGHVQARPFPSGAFTADLREKGAELSKTRSGSRVWISHCQIKPYMIFHAPFCRSLALYQSD